MVRSEYHGVWVLAQGYVLTSEIDGTIQMKSYLTGNPEIKVGLSDDLAVGVRSNNNNTFGKFLVFFL